MRGLALLKPERQPQTRGGHESPQNMLHAQRARDTSHPHQGQGDMLSPEDSGTTGDAGRPGLGAMRVHRARPRCPRRPRGKARGVTPAVPTSVVSEKA